MSEFHRYTGHKIKKVNLSRFEPQIPFSRTFWQNYFSLNFYPALELHQKTTGESINTGQVKSNWEGMGLIIQSYEQNSAEQMDQLKKAIGENKKNLVGKIDKLKLKWNTGKPTGDEIKNPAQMKKVGWQ